jgi:hypothetical protein
MAFDTVRVKKVGKDDEDSFLDWDGRATLFDEDGDAEENEDVESIDPEDVGGEELDDDEI